MASVRIDQGPIRGIEVSTPDGGAEAFLGIPYAADPDAARRWQAAGPPVGWTTERDCTDFGPGAPQKPDRVVGFRIDEAGCLNLNVWTPAGDVRDAPVLVWLHGGAHLYGSNTHPLCDGARLAAAHGVVVVAANYRLGALGYLTLDHLFGPDYQDSGNLALLDAIAALRWVQQSIAAFGGDPDRVTVMGQSAGAVMVATLLSMPAASGLFRRAIVQSGSAERCQDREFGIRRTAELLELLGLTESEAERLLELPADRIVAAQDALIARRSAGRSTLSLAFCPELDGRWLDRAPVDAIADGHGAEIDLIAGTNLNEGSGYADLRGGDDPELLPELTRRLNERLPGHSDSLAAYRNALEAELGRPATTAELLESCIADQLYRQPMQHLLDARSTAVGQGRTYAYLFSWAREDGDWARRAGHSLELPFVFRHVDDSSAALEDVGPRPPLRTRDLLSSAWTTFVATGAPVGNAAPWPEYKPERNTMIITDGAELARDPRSRLRVLGRSA